MYSTWPEYETEKLLLFLPQISGTNEDGFPYVRLWLLGCSLRKRAHMVYFGTVWNMVYYYNIYAVQQDTQSDFNG